MDPKAGARAPLPAEASSSRELDICRTAIDIEALVRQQELIRELMEGVMKRGVHYGRIPGTDKDSLLQPGADLLNRMFRFDTQYEVVSAQRSDLLISYVMRCTIVHIPTGEVWGSGIGAASTKERKYAQALRTLEYTAKKKGKVPPTAFELENTVLKMAAKRAKVHATLGATGASELFEHDDEIVEGDAEDSREGRDRPESSRDSRRSGGQRDERRSAPAKEENRRRIDPKLARAIEEVSPLLTKLGQLGADVKPAWETLEYARDGAASLADVAEVRAWAEKELSEREPKR